MKMTSVAPLKQNGVEDLSLIPIGQKTEHGSPLSAQKTLHECAADGDIDQARAILQDTDNGPDVCFQVNEQDGKGMAPLHHAVKFNQTEMVKFLLENGADLTVRDCDHTTPLHYWAEYGLLIDKQTENDINSTSPLTILIKHGANVNSKDKFGRSPLHIAVLKGNEYSFRELLRHVDTQEEERDNVGNTPLLTAVLKQRPKFVKLLVASGVNLCWKDEYPTTILHLACREGNEAVVKALVKAVTKKYGQKKVQKMLAELDQDGFTCLHLAVKKRHRKVVKLCIGNGSDVNTPDSKGFCPLHHAAMEGELKIVQLLTENGANIDATNTEKATPLMKAILNSHVPIAEYLIEKGANIEVKDEKLRTPLLIACENGLTKAVELLLNKNANIEVKGDRKFTPLLIASANGYAEIVEMLLNKNADVTAMANAKKTVLIHAVEGGDFACVKVLLKNDQVRSMIDDQDTFGNGPIHIAVTKGNLSLVKLLFENGADLRKGNDAHLSEHQTKEAAYPKYKIFEAPSGLVQIGYGRPLHLAAFEGHYELAKMLIDFGADVNASNRFFWTPLHCAASKNMTKTATVLLQGGSSVSPTDPYDMTPLHVAASQGHLEMVELLLSRGADITKQNKYRENSLAIAIEANHNSIVQLILKQNNWKDAMRNAHWNSSILSVDTPMRKLIRKMPDEAKLVLDKCIDYDDKRRYAKKATFLYEFLDDGFYLNEWIGTVGGKYDAKTLLKTEVIYMNDFHFYKQNHPLMVMLNHKREELLSHPLVYVFLQAKWRLAGRPVYYINYLIYSVFLLFLTGYVVSTKPPYIQDATIVNKTSSMSNCEHLEVNGHEQATFANVGKYFVMILVVWNLIREALQFYQAKLYYFTFGNMVELTAYICSFLLVLDFEGCQRQTGYRYEWQWNAGTVAILTAWINLVLFTEKFPKIGIYVLIFKDILRTFFQFFVVFALFIIGFALAFFSLLQNQSAFSTVWESLIKTTVMMTGEFDYGDTYTDGELSYKAANYILFYVFVIVMSIVIMNLLVGLAVDNIKEIQEQANLTRKAVQIGLALDVETFVPHIIRRQFFLVEETIYPQHSCEASVREFFRLDSPKLTRLLAKFVSERDSKSVNEIDELKKSIVDLQRKQRELSDLLKREAQSNIEIKEKLKTMLKQNQNEDKGAV